MPHSVGVLQELIGVQSSTDCLGCSLQQIALNTLYSAVRTSLVRPSLLESALLGIPLKQLVAMCHQDSSDFNLRHNDPYDVNQIRVP